jgi:hypothetical protein
MASKKLFLRTGHSAPSWNISRAIENAYVFKKRNALFFLFFG